MICAEAGLPAFAEGLGFDTLTKFSQVTRLYESETEQIMPVNIHGVVTFVFPDASDGFVLANPARYDDVPIAVKPSDTGQVAEIMSGLAPGEAVEIAGVTGYANHIVHITARQIMRTGFTEMAEPPPLKFSDFRKGWRHLRRNSLTGSVVQAADQPRPDGGRDTVLWVSVGPRQTVPVCVYGGIAGDRAMPGTVICARGLVFSTFDEEGRSVASRLEVASANDIGIIGSNFTFFWRWLAFGGLFVLGVALFVLGTFAFRVARERRLVALIAADRRRIADDLHDNMQQLLAGVGFRLSAAINVAGDRDAVLLQLAHAQKALEHSKAGLRSVLWGLQETKESPNSLLGLFRYAASRMPHWEGVVEICGEGQETPGVRRHGARLLMIMQEAVQNALVHGAARHVEVLVSFTKKGFAMTVRDDGCGFNASQQPGVGHLGIASMRRRADEMHGSFLIASAPGKGTTIKIEVK